MALMHLDSIAADIHLAFWKIEEPEEWFLQQLALSPLEQAEHVKIVAAGRRMEWLAARHLVRVLAWNVGEPYIFQKDGYGKPYLLNSGKHISISHSHGVCAAMIAPVPCGIDVQKIVGKIERLAPRFLSETEMACISTDHKLLHLHLFWGAKESLYKAYGRKELDFREHIPIAPFIPNPAGGTCSGRVCKDDFEADFDIRYAVSEGDFVWVYAVQRMEKLAR